MAIDGVQAERLRAANPFLYADTIAADTYRGVAAVKTLAVAAQWVTSDRMDAELVYQITRALFSDTAKKALSSSHAKGKFITRANAIQGAGICSAARCRSRALRSSCSGGDVGQRKGSKTRLACQPFGRASHEGVGTSAVRQSGAAR